MNSPNYHILINASSGTARKLGFDKIQSSLQDHLFRVKSLDFLESDALDKRMKELLESENPILIGGGDGTIARAAALHLHKDKPFGVLPFGTMNLLAKDLNIPLELSESLKSHQNTRILSVDVGVVNDHSFLCCAALGTMPEAAVMREELRDGSQILMLPRLTNYILEQMERTQKRTIEIAIDGRAKKVHTSMIVVSNNLFDTEEPSQPFKKETLQEGILAVYMVSPKTFGDKLRLLFRLRKSGWQSDPSISQYKAQQVILNTKRSEELISLDGEPITLKTPLKFGILKRALKIIVPAKTIVS